MRRVLYDVAATQGYGSTKFHGGGEYAKTVLRRCLDDRPSDTVFETHTDPSRFLDPEIEDLLRNHGVVNHEVSSARALESLLNRGRYDLYYSALPIDARWEFRIPESTRFLFTLHGLRGIVTRDWHFRTFYGKNALHGIALLAFFYLFGSRRQLSVENRYRRKIETTRNRQIVTVSNYGKFGFVSALPQIDFSDAITLDSVTEPRAPTRDARILKESNLVADSFILMVSANRYEKNAIRALRALDAFFTKTAGRSEYDHLRVAITGLKPDSPLVRRLSLHNSGRFVFLSYVTPGHIEELYASAVCLLYPSLSEGYGYPPVQAMHYETPSICAGATSIPEICGDAAIYFNPHDEDEMVVRLFEVLDPEVRKNLVPRLAPRYEVLRLRQKHALDELSRMITVG